MSQVLEKSINTGAMFVENIVGDENFLNYAINTGFGQRTGIDLPGEVNGDITNLYSGRKVLSDGVIWTRNRSHSHTAYKRVFGYRERR